MTLRLGLNQRIQMEGQQHELTREPKTATSLIGQRVVLKTAIQPESRTWAMIWEQHQLKAARTCSKTLELGHARSLRLTRCTPPIPGEVASVSVERQLSSVTSTTEGLAHIGQISRSIDAESSPSPRGPNSSKSVKPFIDNKDCKRETGQVAGHPSRLLNCCHVYGRGEGNRERERWRESELCEILREHLKAVARMLWCHAVGSV